MAKTILIIDDDDGIVDALVAMVESEGYQTRVMKHGEQIVSLQKNQLPDLILLDVLLSGTDGREICKKLKHQDLTAHIPVILLSAAPQNLENLHEAGADDFLSKPFEMRELFEKITKYTA